MFDKLIELAVQFIELFRCFVVIKQYQQGVVLTLGKLRRPVLMPGLHFVWPLAIDEVMTDHSVPTTHNLATQKLTTKDGVPVAIGVMLRYRIHDMAKALLEVESVDTVIADSAYGELASWVRMCNWTDLKEEAFVTTLYKAIRKRAFRFGVEIEEVQVTDLAKMRVICIIGDESLRKAKPTGEG